MKQLLAILIILSVVLAVCGCSKTSVSEDADVTLTFICGDKDISVTLEASEAEKVIDILNGNNYDSFLTGVPSCGFDKNISLKVGGRTFAIACDTCNCIQDISNLRYFDIPEEDMEYIHSLFEKYGGHFPCVSMERIPLWLISQNESIFALSITIIPLPGHISLQSAPQTGRKSSGQTVGANCVRPPTIYKLTIFT